MTLRIVGFDEGEAAMTWDGLCAALTAGHEKPKAEIGDTFLYRDNDTLLSRAAWITGLGLAVKSATVYPGNLAQGLPMIDGAVTVFNDAGALEALVDFFLVTKWKTACDSLLAARHLARPDSETILIVGAGTVASSLYEAYGSTFPNARFLVWNRTSERAEKFAAARAGVEAVADLETAVGRADIVTSATMSSQPLIHGAWLKAGQHIDLIGAYRPDMREADDAALKRARLFVDSRETTLDDIGEVKIPLSKGIVQRNDIVADFYDLPRGDFLRQSEDEITLFKNGGGAHLDLMTCRYVLDALEEA
ncbi:MAG: ornithine cyclodeaminase [Pseudomonadota bacterium]